MHLSDPEKMALQQMIKGAEQTYKFLQPMIEQVKREHALNWPLIEAMRKLALRDIEANRPYLDPIRLQAIADMERYESIAKQLDQLRPIYSKDLEYLTKHRESFLTTVSGLDRSGLNLTISVEPVVYEERSEPQLVIKNLDDIEEPGVPVEESVEVFGLSDVISGITMKESYDFYNHLSKYPMLGLAHSVGKKIIDGLDKFQLVEVFDITLFKARPLEKGRGILYSEPEMFEAHYGKPDQGRYNVRGQGELYAGDDFEGVIKETTNPDGQKATVMKMTLNESLSILDIASSNCPLFEFCNYPLDESDPNRHAYLVPNFVAQCCKMKGVAGIRYGSLKKPGMINYIFFDISRAWFKDTSISLA